MNSMTTTATEELKRFPAIVMAAMTLVGIAMWLVEGGYSRVNAVDYWSLAVSLVAHWMVGYGLIWFVNRITKDAN